MGLKDSRQFCIAKSFRYVSCSLTLCIEEADLFLSNIFPDDYGKFVYASHLPSPN